MAAATVMESAWVGTANTRSVVRRRGSFMGDGVVSGYKDSTVRMGLPAVPGTEHRTSNIQHRRNQAPTQPSPEYREGGKGRMRFACLIVGMMWVGVVRGAESSASAPSGAF